jgi:putative flippase GtrA
MATEGRPVQIPPLSSHVERRKRLVKLAELVAKYRLLRAAQFGVAGIVGFVAAEGIIVAGLFLAYGSLQVPDGFSSSPAVLAIDVVAFVVGVTVGFLVNERTTVRGAPRRANDGRRGTLVRLAKYQGVYVVGNGITIGTQLALLAAFALSPAVGVIVGAMAAYPVSYFASMKVVWKV